MTERRVVVTGCGALCCLGTDVNEIWTNLIEGKCGIGPITQFDALEYKSRIAGEIRGFDPAEYFSEKEVRHLDRFVQLSAAAADEAMESAGLPRCPAEAGLNAKRIGCLVSSGVGGLHEISDGEAILRERGPGKLSPFMIPKMTIDMAAVTLAIRYGLRGPNFSVVSACTTGSNSIGEAYHIIKRNDADIMVAGGSEASIHKLFLGGFNALTALSTRNDDPLHASRPFDRDRDGFVPSEGAGVVVLEELEHAKKRGSRILCEIIGYGATSDGFHITRPIPEGEGDADAFRIAMEHAGIRPKDIDYINAHGTSTVINDKFETLAIKHAFGNAVRQVAISSTKGATGHSLGASGALESIFCMKAIESGIVPPTINYENPDPDCDLDVTPNTARKRDIRIAANNNLAFGGHNAVLLFKKFIQ